ncbi:hypothetical protein LWE61_08325 [Sphingobium sufflavum]|uniref:hypothetical protein n=1 Tax=Sphingobium sufflavum TaxID=1129547 RepID=UPI001F371F9D|nr:hypothetical protein [Sphingobium sufflavum]MCE7796567.1 hypothetical protein [Sphingobium sufflavum]
MVTQNPDDLPLDELLDLLQSEVMAAPVLLGTVALAGAYLAGHGNPIVGDGIAAGALVAVIVTVRVSASLICTLYVNTVLHMEALAAGDLTSPIQYRDCVGRMTKAMAVFRDNREQVRASAESATAVVAQLGLGLDAMASGKMTYTIATAFVGGYDRLRMTFNRTVEGL